MQEGGWGGRDTLHEHCQQIILGYRGQQVPEWHGVLPPNYKQWSFSIKWLYVAVGEGYRLGVGG